MLKQMLTRSMRVAQKVSPTNYDRIVSNMVEQSRGSVARAVLGRLRADPANRDDPLQFLAFAAPLAGRSEAQLFQDLWALWENPEGGYFVEFGAGDGRYLSNTYLLEQMGWRGLVAEPNPETIGKVRKQRGCYVSDKCVFTETGRTIPFLVAAEGEYSRIAGIEAHDDHEHSQRTGARTVEVATITLDALLREAGAPARIAYMSIDTEGSELDILASFDFSAWDVRSLSVEHNGDKTRRAAFLALLSRHGYRRKWPELSMWDDWYVKATW